MDEMVNIPLCRYEQLVKTNERVQALIAYLRRYDYSIDKEMVGGILGFDVRNIKDGNGGE